MRRAAGVWLAALAVVAALLPGLLFTTASADSPGPAATRAILPSAVSTGLLIDEANDRVWVTQSESTTITVTKLDGTAPRDVPLGFGGRGLTLSPDGRFVHVARAPSLQPTSSDIVTYRAVDLVEVSRTSVGQDRCPRDLAYAGGRLWVAHGGCGDNRGDLAPVDPWVSFFPLPQPERFGSGPEIESVGPSSTQIVAAGVVRDSAIVQVYDVSTTVPQLVRSTAGKYDYGSYRVGGLAVHAGRGLIAVSLPVLGPRLLRLSDLTEVRRFPPRQVQGLSFDASGRHLLMAAEDQHDGVVSYPVDQDLVAHGRMMRADHVAWSSDGRAYAAGGELLVQAGWNLDPLDLRLQVAQDRVMPGGSVDIGGQIATTDGTAVPRTALTVTRSGPNGSVLLPPASPAVDGSFRVTDRPPAAGGYTYRVASAGAAGRARATSQVSIRVGDLAPAMPARPATRGTITTHDVAQPAVYDLIVDDLHRRVYVSGGKGSSGVSVLDFDGSEVGRLPLTDAGPLHLSADRTTLFVGLLDEPTVVVLDAATGSEVDRWWLGPTAGAVYDLALVGNLLLWTATGYPGGSGWLDPARTRRTSETGRGGFTNFLSDPDDPARVVTRNETADVTLVRVEGGSVRVESGPCRVSPGNGSNYSFEQYTPGGELVDVLAYGGARSNNGGARFPLSQLTVPYGGRCGTPEVREIDPAYEPPYGDDSEASGVTVSADGRFAAVSWETYVLRLLPFDRPGEPFWQEQVLSQEPSKLGSTADGSRLFAVTHAGPYLATRTQITVIRDPFGGTGDQRPLPPRRIDAVQGQTTMHVRWDVSQDDGGRPVTGYQVSTDNGAPTVQLAADVRELVLAGTGPQTTVSVRAVNALGTGRARSVSPAPCGASARVQGPIRERYLSLNGACGILAHALTDELATPSRPGRYNHFEGGSIYWSAATGAWEVHGGIRQVWSQLGSENSAVGLPTTNELGAGDGRGRFNHFERGSVYWTPSTGAQEVRGAIRDTWWRLGGERSAVGYPVTHELGTPDGRGRFNHFERGSVYWTAASGAHEIRGAFRVFWSSTGWERGWLGYPVTDEYPHPGGQGQDFEFGRLRWNASTGHVSAEGR